MDIGLCDHHGRYMEFYGDRNYVRKAFRSDTVGFKALEKREIVVEMDSSKNMVVFVPLLGPSTGHGVLEIHGLLPMNLPADQAYFQRPIEMLKTMLNHKDYR